MGKDFTKRLDAQRQQAGVAEPVDFDVIADNLLRQVRNRYGMAENIDGEIRSVPVGEQPRYREAETQFWQAVRDCAYATAVDRLADPAQKPVLQNGHRTRAQALEAISNAASVLTGLPGRSTNSFSNVTCAIDRGLEGYEDDKAKNTRQ